jgi:parallel beta-helix repeat protein
MKTVLLAILLLLSTGTFAVPLVFAGSELHVGLGEVYSTIQDAIDAAGPGDTVIVHEGIYVEDLLITKELELKTYDDDEVTIKGVATEPWGNWPLATSNIEILSDSVIIKGFQIESPDVPGTDYSSGIVINGTGVKICENLFNSTGEAGSGCVVIQTYRHIGGLPYSDVTGLKIMENEFISTGDTEYIGVFINHDATGDPWARVKDNELSGSIVYGIVTERNCTVIKENTMVQDSTGSGIGVVVMDWDQLLQRKVIVKENTIEGFERAIVIGHSSLEQKLDEIMVKENELKSNSIGIQLRGNDVMVKENEVEESSSSGILVLGNNCKLKENKVSEGLGDGIVIEGNSNKLKENTAEANLLNGYLITGDMNVLKENESTENGEFGYKVDGDNNLFKENKAEDNGFGSLSDGGTGNTYHENEF